MRSRVHSSDGTSLVDVLLVLGFLAVLGAIAVPGVQNFSAAIALGQAQQLVESELQQARLKAVSTNRVMRVRFNCPGAGQFRMVELIGTPAAPAAADTAPNRCSITAFPYPAADRNALTRPNHDGPLKEINQRVVFGAAPTIEFWPTGAAYTVNADGTSAALPGGASSITVTKGTVTKTVTVNGLGKVEGVQ